MKAASWEKRTLGSCAKFLSGGTPAKSREDYWSGEIPWVSSGEMTNLRLFDTSHHVSLEGARNGSRIVPRNTVLAVVRGMSLAKEFRVSIIKNEMAFNQDLKAFDCNDGIDSEFLFYALLARREHIRGLSTEASHGTKRLETDVLSAVEISVPSRIEDQREVVSVLSAYDDLIENNRRRIVLLERAARELYREWFVRLHFPGHEHTKIIDGVPEGWGRRTLGEIADTNAETYRAKELPDVLNYIDISSVSAGHIVEKKNMTLPEAPGRARRKAKHGDIVWSNVRPNLKAYSLVLNPEENDVFSTGFTVLSARGVPFTFLYQHVTSDQFVSYLVNQTTGASYPAVRPDDFERAEMLIPGNSLLDEFHSICLQNHELIGKLMKQNDRLTQARDLLLPRLMDGRLEV